MKVVVFKIPLFGFQLFLGCLFFLDDDIFSNYFKNGETRKQTGLKHGGQGLPG